MNKLTKKDIKNFLSKSETLTLKEFKKIEKYVDEKFGIFICPFCFAKGCDVCNNVGVFKLFEFNGVTYKRSPDIIKFGVGGSLSITNSINSQYIKLYLDSMENSNVEIYIHKKELANIITGLAQILSDFNYGINKSYPVLTKIFGPPILNVTTDADVITTTNLPNDSQQKAIKLLQENGFYKEANMIRHIVRIVKE